MSDQLVLAAKFAAKTWYEEVRPCDSEETKQFVNQNWESFVPFVHEGLGEFLERIFIKPKADDCQPLKIAI